MILFFIQSVRHNKKSQHNGSLTGGYRILGVLQPGLHNACMGQRYDTIFV